MNTAHKRVVVDARAHALAELLDIERMRVDRQAFIDPDIYQLEIKKIWETTWLYLAHESQIPNRFDYLKTHMGSHSVFLWRTLRALSNAFLTLAHIGGQRFVILALEMRARLVAAFMVGLMIRMVTFLQCRESRRREITQSFQKRTLA